MGRHVDRKFIVFSLETYFLAQNNHYFDCVCFKCERLQNLLKQIKKNKFTSNVKHKKWFIIFHRKLGSKVTLFPVFI